MCNAWNHHPDCTCGWGGEGHLGIGGGRLNSNLIRDIPLNTIWSYSNDYCAPSICPECGDDVFFIRHNDGSVWVDSLGWPWPKHPCMDTQESRENEPTWFRYFKEKTNSENSENFDKNAIQNNYKGKLFNGIVVWSMWQSGKDGKSSRILLAIDGGRIGKVCIAIKGNTTASYFDGKIIIVDFNTGLILSSSHDLCEVVEFNIDPEILGFENDWAKCRCV